MRFVSNEITLYAATKNIYEFLYDIRLDSEVCDNLFSHMPTSYEEHVKYLDSLQGNQHNKVFICRSGCDNIGVLRLKNIDYKNGTAEIGADVHHKQRRKGLGTKIYLAAIDMCKNQMNIRKLYLHVFSFNKVAIEMYKKLGFETIVVLKEHIFKNGKYQDVIMMEMFL